MSKTTIYFAGPITGLTYEEATGWRKQVRSALPSDWRILDPMRGKSHLKDDPRVKGRPLAANFDSGMDAVSRDLSDIRAADVVLAHFAATDAAPGVSLGTSCEIGYAYAIGTPVVAVVRRNTPYDHIFIDHMCTVVRSTEGAIQAIRRLTNAESALAVSQ